MDKGWPGLCPGCFRDKNGAGVCPHCGYDESSRRGPLVLPHRTLLQRQYLIGAVLGKPGGFGITYLALDTRLETLVAVKEYLPRDLVGRDTGAVQVSTHSRDEEALFRFGLGQFLNEARTLAKFDHAHLVRVRNVFEENGTAYLVMDYYEGASLASYLEKKGRLPEKTALDILMPILDGLREVHGKGFLHRDIKPQNIYLTTEGRPILLDFGSARMAMGEHSNTLSVVLTPGYAPFEQYHRKGEQGPWTDIYSCAAVLYQMLTGATPPDAPERTDQDTLIPPKSLVPELSPHLNQAILQGLAVKPSQRPQTVRVFQDQLRLSSYASPNAATNVFATGSTALLTTTPYAGFWQRFAASLVDGIAISISIFTVDFALGFGFGMAGLAEASISLGLTVQVLNLLLSWLYFAGMECSQHQATAGKLALGLKVTDLNGQRISFGRASGRFFGKYLSSLLLGIGFIMAAFTQSKQALHDKMAKCLVVKKTAFPSVAQDAADSGLTPGILLCFAAAMALCLVGFGIGAQYELKLSAMDDRPEVGVQAIDLQSKQEELARQQAEREAAKQERAMAAKLAAQREAEEQEFQKQRELLRKNAQGTENAEKMAMATVVAYYNALGKDPSAALGQWTEPETRPKVAKLINNTEYAQVISVGLVAIGDTNATVSIDVVVKAYNTPAQRWNGYAELQAVSGRWLIASLKGMKEVK